MDKKLINRRSFFKKAASAALPILAAITVPSLLTSCEIDEPYLDGGGSSSGCSGCGSGCKNTCKGLCTRNCASTCKSQSYNTAGCSGSSCKGHCFGSCKDTCSSSSK